MFKVRFKSKNASQAWSTHGSYGNESSALANASRISARYFMVQVIDKNNMVIWSG